MFFISLAIVVGACILAEAIKYGIEEAGKRIACGIEHIGEYTIYKDKRNRE